MLSEYLLIGEITRPQGVRGEMRVKPCTDDPMRFAELEQVYFKQGDAYAPRGMKFVRLAGPDVVIIRLDGVDDANAVEALRGRELYVDRAHAVELPEDADFIVDLIGCRVVDVMQPGGGDVYVIDGPRGEVLVPALKSVVLDVDTRSGLMRMSAARMREVAVFED